MRHLTSILFLALLAPPASAVELRVDGSSENGLVVTSEPSIALTGAVSAARLWWTDSRGVRGDVAIADGRFATGPIPIPAGYSGLTLTAVDVDGSVTSRFVGILSEYRPSEPPVFEGDILPVRPAAAGKIGNERQGLAIQYPGGLWSRDPVTNIVRVPYVITNATFAADAVASFNQTFSGQVQWVPRVAETDYVDFALTANYPSQSCASNLGRIGDRQTIIGTTNCGLSVLLHEMGHAVGLYHEHQRADASTWLTLYASNVDRPFLAGNFYSSSRNAQNVGLFDYASIMHYPPRGFSKNRLLVLDSITPGIPFGDLSQFSVGDIDQIRRLYGFTPSQVTVTTQPPGLPIIVDGTTYNSSPQTFTWALGTQHTLSVPAGFHDRGDGSRYQFGNWNDGLPQTHTITVAPGSGTRVSPSNLPAVTVYQAGFVRYNQVNVSATGNGTVQITPALTTIGVQTYAVHNSTLIATPQPGVGSRFRRWQGTERFPQGQSPRSFLIYSTGWNITAEFTTDPAIYQVSASFTNPPPPASPANASVSVVVDGTSEVVPQNFSATDGWTAGSAHSLGVASNQTPETTNIRYDFNSWTTGNPVIASLPASSTNWVASFTPSYSGSSILYNTCASNPATVPVADGFYADGISVPFSVTPATGWFFTGWYGDLTGTANPTTLLVRDQFIVEGTFNTSSTEIDLVSLSPASAVRGTSSQVVLINGTGFTLATRVFVNNIFRSSSFVSSTQLRVTLNSTDLGTAGGLAIGVYNFTTTPSCGLYLEVTFDVITPDALWAITKTHVGNFTQGQSGSYTITARNAGGTATVGLVTVTDLPPTGLTVTGLAGTGWTCSVPSASCTRQDALAAGASYPAITATVAVGLNEAASVTNQATVSGGNVALNATASDPTTVTPVAATVAVSAGNNQSAALSTNFPTALAAVVRDGNGTGVSGVTVTFTAPASGASGLFANNTITTTASTGANGIATASAFRANATAGGPYTITASVAGINTPANFSLTNSLGTQTINFAPLSGQLLSVGSIVLTATATSGLAVAYTSNSLAVCTVSNATVTLLTAGQCSITANQAGSANFAAAAPVTQTFAVSQANQTISFGSLADRTLNSGSFVVAATATSGLTVTFSGSTPLVCGVSGTTVTLIAAGQCSVKASQAGNGTFTAAPDVLQSFNVTQSPQTISFAAIAGQTLVNPSLTLTATASSGLTVTYNSLTPAICTVSGATANLIAIGQCSLRASQAGNAAFAAAADVNQSFAISQATQTINFAVLPGQVFGVPPLALSASATSNLAVAFSATPSNVCSINGATVVVVAAGQCSVRASQAGNTAYSAAIDVTRAFTVAPANQTITFTAVGSQTLSLRSVRLFAASDSNLPISFSSDTPLTCTVLGFDATLVTAGACTLRAVQAGNANYNAATPAVQTFTITPSTQTITFAALSSLSLSAGSVPLSASATSFLIVTFSSSTPLVCTVSGTTLNLLAVGNCTVQANQAGNANFLAAAPVTQQFAISQGSQTISFGTLQNVTFGVAPIVLSATATSGLPVAFATSTPSVCSVTGSTLTIAAGGICSVQASQNGNANFAAAVPVTQSFTVNPAAQSINFAALPTVPFSAVPIALSATATSGLPVTLTSLTTAVCSLAGSSLTLNSGGLCTVQATQAGNSSYSAAIPVTQTFTIATAPQSITFAALPNLVFGNVSVPLIATASSNLPVEFSSTTPLVCSVSNASMALLNGGICTIRAAQAGNVNYAAAAPVLQSFTVTPAAQSITFAALPSVPFGTASFGVTATASSGLPVSFTSTTPTVCSAGGAVTILAAGTCTIQAAQAGDARYAAAAVVGNSFTVTPAAQSISFGALLSRTLGAVPFAISATATSGLPVLFSSLTPAVCAVQGGQVTLAAAGLCTIVASQAGNGNFAAAVEVPQSFSVAPNGQGITFLTVPAGLPLDVNGQVVTGGSVVVLTPGTYTVTAINPTPANGTRYQWASWSNGGAQSQQIVVAAAPASYTATYVMNYLLTTGVTGAGTISPATGYYPAGALQITATPAAGNVFRAFSGAITGNTNPRSLNFTAPATLSAAFAAVPLINWSNPADLVVGTPLSNTQLNATANVPGTFSYTPAAGTLLPLALNQTLTVNFTPTDSVTYAATSRTVTINVVPAQLQLAGFTPVLVFQVSRLRRDATSGEIIVELVAANFGPVPARNTRLVSATIGSTVVAPNVTFGNLGTGNLGIVQFRLPGNTTGTSLTWSGTYEGGGTFSGTATVTLP